MSRTRVVIQSRLNSSRLPGKALMTIGGMPLVELVARRAARSGHEVVVATSEEHYDQRIVDHLDTVGIPVVRGSLDDVLGRFVAATRDLEPGDTVVRLTGDNPVGDADVIDDLASAMARGGYAYGRNDVSRMPEGLGCEVFSIDDLRRADREATTAYDREHVTPWLRRHVRTLDHVPAQSPTDIHRFRCTVDVLNDYVRVSRMFGGVADPVAIPWTALMDRLRELIREEGPSVPTRDRSGLGQSVLLLGGTQLAGAGASPPPEVRALLAHAADRGITHVEVGRADGDAEAVLRACGEPQLTKRFGYVSRVRPLGADAHDPLAVEASVERSFAELGRRSVAAAVLDDLSDARPATWERLRAYVGGGEVQRVGVAVRTAEQVPEALRLPGLGYLELPLRPGTSIPDEVQQALRGADVVVTAHSVFDGGSVLDQNDPRNARLRALATDLGRDGVDDLCLAYALGHDVVTSVAVGCDDEPQLQRNADLAARPPLDDEQRARVRDVLGKD